MFSRGGSFFGEFMSSNTEPAVEQSLKTIELIPVSITRDEAASIVLAHAGEYSVQVQKLIYYPYLWVYFKYTVKTLLGKSRIIDASCLVDLINNQGATTDRFELSSESVPADNILEPDYDSETALATAKSYLLHASINKMKALLTPRYEVVENKQIYKPFWIVRCTNRSRDSFKVIVDSLTGKFQVL